jgi:hypothetical protein
MAKPNFKVTKTDGETGKTTTIGRHTTDQAARTSKQAKDKTRELGSSDYHGVREIQHRK